MTIDRDKSSEDIKELLTNISLYHKYDLHSWLQENLLTKNEVIDYTDQSEYGLKQSVRTGNFIPFYSKGDGRGKVNLFLKSEAIEYGKQKRKNVLRGAKHK